MPFINSFSELFHTRSEYNSEEARAYLAGLMAGKRGAKNMERMEEDVPDFHYQRVHNFISHSPWDHRAVIDEVARRADGLLGGAPRTRVVIDESGFEKKGSESVGVARQYNGRLGKVENSQVAVFSSLAAGQQSTLVDARLYLPQEQWCQDEERCRKAGIPQEQRVFRTKPQLALESIRHLRQLGVHFHVVSADSGYGSDNAFLHELDGDGEIFVAEVHCDQHIWTEAPWPHQEGARAGKPRKTPKASHPSQRVDHWAAAQQETDWRRLKVRDSDQGWVEVNYLARRVWLLHNGESKLWWLLVWENPDESSNDGSKKKLPRRHYALSNAPADEDPRVLVTDGVQRNTVERNFRDAKTEVGMADYQTRGWRAWHHHMALVMMAMLFLTQEKMHSPRPQTVEGPVNITAGDVTFILERMLPRRAHGPVNASEVKRLLEARVANRVKDQVRRRRKDREIRPVLWADEVLSEMTK